MQNENQLAKSVKLMDRPAKSAIGSLQTGLERQIMGLSSHFLALCLTAVLSPKPTTPLSPARPRNVAATEPIAECPILANNIALRSYI